MTRPHPGLAELPLTGGTLALAAFVVLGAPGAALYRYAVVAPFTAPELAGAARTR